MRYILGGVIVFVLFILTTNNSSFVSPASENFDTVQYAELGGYDNEEAFNNSEHQTTSALQDRKEGKVISLPVAPSSPELKNAVFEERSDAPLMTQELSIAPIHHEEYRVLRVIDGDTIDVETSAGVKRVRYIGVDTPETVHPSKPVECMGKEASAYNKSLVEGKMVRLERDVSDSDKYGRWLRYVYVDNQMVNELLLQEGYANMVTYAPDVRYVEHFRILEQQAREEQKGLWGSTCAEYTTGSEVVRPVVQTSANDSTCSIKGNISSAKEKIYHVPGCQSYEKTIINEESGEQWFCTEEEAHSAGWRKALNCS